MRSMIRLTACLLAGWLAAGCAAHGDAPAIAKTPEPSPAMTGHSAYSFAYVVLSVADLDQALELWQQRFGMEVVTRRHGADAGLAKLWNIAADDIKDQALLNTPGSLDGGLHLVQFARPGAAIREGARSTDLVLKNIDIAARDIKARHQELLDAGMKFRSAIGTLESDGVLVYEVHAPGPEGINLVFLEQPDVPQLTSRQGYGVTPQIVAITPDNEREVAFYRGLFGMEQLSHHRFEGPEVEKTIGLPSGAALDVRIVGNAKSAYGRMELVNYQGAPGDNLYPRARPPARGLLSVTYVVANLGGYLERGRNWGIVDHGPIESILGKGRMASVTTPAGMRIDIVEL
ncbi:MAG: VOC family protein [Steroidobacteraceae bacterium]